MNKKNMEGFLQLRKNSSSQKNTEKKKKKKKKDPCWAVIHLWILENVLFRALI